MLAQLLIVEDDPHLGPLLRDYLSADYQVFHASTIKEAQAWLGTHSAQLILLDLNLPDGNGLDLAKQLRAEQVMTPIIVVTGDVFGCNREIVLAAGCTDFRAKPLFVEDLEALFIQYAAR